MKTLKDYSCEIKKCSKCGLCQSVCPVYKETGNDCAVSRGKFVMLDGILRGDLTLNKTVNKYLDLCMKCGKCKDFCPSDIDVCKIFEAAKYEYMRKTLSGKLHWFLYEIIFSSLKKIKLKSYPQNHSSLMKIVYFKGCVNKVYPKAEKALKKVLQHYDVEICEKNFDCCGLPFLSNGNLERFEKAKEKNLKNLEGDFDYILTDCASCEYTLREYGLDNVINIGDFIAQYPKKFIFKIPVTVTFHKPCHLKDISFLKNILTICENVQYVECEGYDECCGFAGEFAVNNPKISRKISAQKADNIMKIGADYVLTMCPSCNMGLQYGFLSNGQIRHPKIKNLIEFLALADEIR